jgi:hypothetical protein
MVQLGALSDCALARRIGPEGFIHQAAACLSDEETVEKIRENYYIQFILSVAGYSSKTPYDPSMMVDFR